MDKIAWFVRPDRATFAIVHREDARSARLKARGALIAVAEMSDVERIAEAFKNVQGA